MVRLPHRAVLIVALALSVPGATTALTPVETVPLYVTGSVLSCPSIGGCAYLITTQLEDRAPATAELDWTDPGRLEVPDGPIRVPAGSLQVTVEGRSIVDDSSDGQPELGPSFATCDLALDVPADPRGLELTLVMAHAACIVEAVPSERAGPEASPSPISPLLALHALPAGLDPAQARPPFSTLLPTSEPGVVIAERFTMSLGHCGLGSPVDIDGSFWDPIGAIEAGMGPVASEDAGIELINATPVEAVLVAADRLDLRTPLGTVVVLARHDGPGEYPGCD